MVVNSVGKFWIHVIDTEHSSISRDILLCSVSITLRFLLYVLVLLYLLFGKICLIFTYTYRTTIVLFFLVHEILKFLKLFFIFQTYVPYDLKIKVCNIYKYRTYNRNLRVRRFGLATRNLCEKYVYFTNVLQTKFLTNVN